MRIPDASLDPESTPLISAISQGLHRTWLAHVDYCRRMDKNVSLLTRRAFMAAGAMAAAAPFTGCIAKPMPVRSAYASLIPEHTTSMWVNDVHAQLNATRVTSIVKPASTDELIAAVVAARRDGTQVSICGGRHAMGGQQFGEATLLLDTRSTNRVLAFDRDRGVIAVEGGIQWPELLAVLQRRPD